MDSNLARQSNRTIILRAVIPVLVIFITIFATLYFVAIPYLENKLIDSKKIMLKELAQTTTEIIEDYDYKAANGLMTIEEAKMQVSDVIKSMKYGDDRKDYFWINDLRPVMIMHPYNTELIGKNISQLEDVNGFKFIQEIVKLAAVDGEGYVNYSWEKKGQGMIIAPKLSYVKLYEPWGWIIGTGVYMDDVEAEISDITNHLSIGFILSLVIICGISFYNIQRSIKTEKENYARGNELIRTSEKYKNLAEMLPEIIFECDGQGKLTFANKNAFEAYGFDMNDFEQGMNIFASVLPRERERFQQIIHRTLQGEVIGNKEFTAVKKDKSTFPVVFYTSPITQNGLITGVRGLIIDISERKIIEKKLIGITKKTNELNKTLEEKVRERTARLEEVNKELEAFSYSVAHDLRTPLGVIEGFAKTLHQEYSELIDENGHMFINTILRNIEEMFQLIEDILEFSKVNRSELQKTTINMKQMFEDIAKVHIDLAKGRQIKFSVENLPSASGDERLIRQVVSNLVSNAVKYTGKKELAEIYVNSYKMDNQIIYSVKDNGAGFDQKYAEKVFQVFQRVHDATEFKGTGVGLAIVSKIIKRHSGKIWAEGKPNEGATFYFSLPKNGA